MSKNATRHIRRKAESKVDKHQSRVLRGEMENVREVKLRVSPTTSLGLNLPTNNL